MDDIIGMAYVNIMRHAGRNGELSRRLDAWSAESAVLERVDYDVYRATYNDCLCTGRSIMDAAIRVLGSALRAGARARERTLRGAVHASRMTVLKHACRGGGGTVNLFNYEFDARWRARRLVSDEISGAVGVVMCANRARDERGVFKAALLAADSSKGGADA